MQSVRQRDTGPERAVRSLLHALGYRYRLHRKDLPGRPDVVFPSRHKAIFVHGCFWHGHDCAKGRAPKSGLDYWGPKLTMNKERDRRQVEALAAGGWATLTVWQCEMRDSVALADRLTGFLES